MSRSFFGDFKVNHGNEYITENRITSDMLTSFEIVRILGIRGDQIEKTNVHLAGQTNYTDPKKIALKELLMKKCPLILYRPIKPGVYERWDPNEMRIPFHVVAVDSDVIDF